MARSRSAVVRPSSPSAEEAKRRREDAVLARAERILEGRMRRLGCIRNPREAERYFRMRLAGLPHEELHALWLDARHRVIGCDVLAKGGADRAEVDPSVVLHLAIRRNARAVVLAHNHPSGVCAPSAGDAAITSRLAQSFELVGVLLLDHLIVGQGAAYSFRESRALELSTASRNGRRAVRR
jgi:DNA repair protein RadC